MLNDADNFEIKVKRYNEVLRHEIIHAMFYESGLMEYCDNEELVNYIAMQTPKLFDIFNSLTIC